MLAGLKRLLPSFAGGGPRIGKYRIIRRLAEGGMGEIFLARSVGRSGFEKLVVLKKILPKNMANREAVRMFLDEARLMAGLSHPNIVHVYDFGTAQGSYFFTMEYVHGQDLAQIVKSAVTVGRSLPLEFALGVIAEAAAGLHHAHEKRGADGTALQIVHRDMSPSNVLVAYDGTVKVTDFGIAKWSQREAKTRYGALKGKIAYMSPEQGRGQPLDRRSDVFALGILLFELLTGTRLYQGTSDYAILEQVVNRDPPPPSSRRRDLPPALEMIVLRALARDPARRYGTAGDLQQAIEDFAREAKLKISAAARAGEMEALFAARIEAFRRAQEQGRSLGQHLAALPPGNLNEGDEDTGAEIVGRDGGTAALPERSPGSGSVPTAVGWTGRGWPWVTGVSVVCLLMGGVAVGGWWPRPKVVRVPSGRAGAPPTALTQPREPVVEALPSAPVTLSSPPVDRPVDPATPASRPVHKPRAHAARKGHSPPVPAAHPRVADPDSIYLPQ